MATERSLAEPESSEFASARECETFAMTMGTASPSVPRLKTATEASTSYAALGATLVEMEEEPLSDERALVARAAHDPDAFAELYRRYVDRVHSFAYRRTGSVEAAEDICAATFEAALRTFDRFSWRSGGFAPWLFRIASRQTIAHHRKESRFGSERGQRAAATLAPGEVQSAADAYAALEPNVDQLRRALDALNPRYQQAIALRYLAELEIGQAASAMRLSSSAFSVVLSRATKALRRELDRQEGDYDV